MPKAELANLRPWTIGAVACRYCGRWHEADEDGVIQGMCPPERKARGPKRWRLIRRPTGGESEGVMAEAALDPFKSKGFDERCEDLARHFLPDTAPADDVAELSQVIQDAIEDWLSEWEERAVA